MRTGTAGDHGLGAFVNVTEVVAREGLGRPSEVRLLLRLWELSPGPLIRNVHLWI